MKKNSRLVADTHNIMEQKEIESWHPTRFIIVLHYEHPVQVNFWNKFTSNDEISLKQYLDNKWSYINSFLAEVWNSLVQINNNDFHCEMHFIWLR